MPKFRRNRKRTEPPKTLKGWKEIGTYLGIGHATAQHWAKTGMPVRREGRCAVADTDELRKWLGEQTHMPGPAHVMTKGEDISAALKESISAVRRRNRSTQ